MVTVIKSTGDKEQFSEEKIKSSIARAGIPSQLQQQVLDHVKSKLYENIPTSEIYHHITEFLHKSSLPFAASRYSLKQSIMELGPSGYPFEDYLEQILKEEGFATKVRQTLQGACITHEIDVVVERDGKRGIVEAKFHNGPGIKTTVHVALYTKARFEDVREKNNIDEAWLICNTSITTDAISYANCVGMQVISWNYPNDGSLRELIEKHYLFPITALRNLTFSQKQTLLINHIVLCRDICKDQSV